MNKPLLPSRCARSVVTILLLVLPSVQRAVAVDALLLQDTYVDNGAGGGKSPPNASNSGTGSDLRVFKGSGRAGRAFLKFDVATVPPGTRASDVAQARLKL